MKPQWILFKNDDGTITYINLSLVESIYLCLDYNNVEMVNLYSTNGIDVGTHNQEIIDKIKVYLSGVTI